ncbi:MAG: glycosyltransferase [Candidatus Omnitrophota bacterium]
MKGSVIIPVRGDAPYLARCLESVIKGAGSFEIILVDDGLTLEAREQLKAFEGRVRVLESTGKGASRARNLAARQSSADFIAFTDSDCIVDRHWIEELLKGFDAFPGVVACGGPQRLPADATAFEARVFLFMQHAGIISDYVRTPSGDRIVFVKHNPSCNVMYKRDIFLESGGFLENFWPGEDVELDWRLHGKGYSLVTNPKAVVYHYKPTDMALFARMMSRYGWAQGCLVRMHGVTRLLHLAALGALAVLLIVIALFIINPFAAVSLIVGMAAALYVYCCFRRLDLRLLLTGIFFWHRGFLKGICAPGR